LYFRFIIVRNRLRIINPGEPGERGLAIMNTFWLKVLVVLAVAVAIGALFMWIRSDIKETENPETTFGDMVEKDREELMAEPNAKDIVSPSSQPEAIKPPEPEKTVQPAEPPPPTTTAEPVTFYFTKLDETDDIAAEQLLSMIPTGRSIGRLPMTSYNLMVETCRQIISRFPGSIYDYKARRALGQIPEQYRARHRITDEELDLTRFTQPRPNTTPYTIKEEE
jgi:hypothetical protein